MKNWVYGTGNSFEGMDGAVSTNTSDNTLGVHRFDQCKVSNVEYTPYQQQLTYERMDELCQEELSSISDMDSQQDIERK